MMLFTGMLLLLGHVAWASSSSQLRIEEKPQDKVLEAFDKLTLRCIITGGDVKFLWTYVNAQTKTLESLTDNQMAVIKTVNKHFRHRSNESYHSPETYT